MIMIRNLRKSDFLRNFGLVKIVHNKDKWKVEVKFENSTKLRICYLFIEIKR